MSADDLTLNRPFVIAPYGHFTRLLLERETAKADSRIRLTVLHYTGEGQAVLLEPLQLAQLVAMCVTLLDGERLEHVAAAVQARVEQEAARVARWNAMPTRPDAEAEPPR